VFKLSKGSSGTWPNHFKDYQNPNIFQMRRKALVFTFISYIYQFGSFVEDPLQSHRRIEFQQAISVCGQSSW